jgi:FGGY-family pentulose kinase
VVDDNGMASTSGAFYIGIDVGTGSARAGVFDARGTLVGTAAEPIKIWKPAAEFVEQSSDDIWRACGVAVRGAVARSGVSPEDIRGLGFDATCSLVALDGEDRPVSVSPTGSDEQNVIVWMDHRAVAQADRISRGQFEVLRFVGGTMSPEMEIPKVLWLSEHLPTSFARAARFFDLPDFLVYRATGDDVRSLCTTVCKWAFLGQEASWDGAFLRAVGLGVLVDEGYRRIGTRVRPVGERAGRLTARAASELGLAMGTPVAVAVIDAHAGGVGTLGLTLDGSSDSTSADVGADLLERRVALIGGTSSCHMIVSREPHFVPGVWGPYLSAMVPGLWLTEGGQSATGALIDHTIRSHARGADLAAEAEARCTTVYALLNERVARIAADRGAAFPAEIVRGLHVLPDHHGNRSPRADPTLRGMVSGLALDDSMDALALLYLATVQALAHGTKHVLDACNAAGHHVDTIVACGGDAKNPLFLREHADITGCRILLPATSEAVLLGSAMLGAVAAGDVPSVTAAMSAMSRAGPSPQGSVIEPAPPGGAVAEFHAKKHRVFLRLYEDQLAYRAIMA